MTVSERIPFRGLLLPLQEGYTYSCDRRTTDGMELLFISREDGSGELRLSGAPYKFRFTLSGRTLSIVERKDPPNAADQSHALHP